MNNTLKQASLSSQQEFMLAMASTAFKETAKNYHLTGEIFPCGESCKDLSPVKINPMPLHMQNNEGR